MDLSEIYSRMLNKNQQMRNLANECGEVYVGETMVKIWQAVAAMEEDTARLLAALAKSKE